MRPSTWLSFISAVSVLLCLPACDGNSAAEAEVDPEIKALNEKPGVRAKRLSDLVEHNNGTFTYKGDLFSGRAVKLAADGNRVFEKHFWEGRLHGSVREFYTDGSVKSDVRYEDGVVNGITIEYDPYGERTEIYYENGVEVERIEPEKKEEEASE